MKRESPKRREARGLPREIIFQHLEKIPAKSDVTIGYLEKNVWWWRILNYKRELWIQDQFDLWPNCDIYRLLDALAPEAKRWLLNKQDAEIFMQDNRAVFDTPAAREVVNRWWSCEEDAAVGYEWLAREQGCYPEGVPYLCVPLANRDKWRAKFYKLNLHYVPAVWQEGDMTDIVESHLLKDKWTQLFRLNLIQPDGYILRELKILLARERQRLGLPNLGPNEQNRRRRTRPLSWAHIENVDIKTHSNQVTSSRTRQAESRNRRKV